MYNYPYGDSQQLNLDWMIRVFRTFQKQIEDAIAPQYDANTTYDYYAIVWYNHVLYANPDLLPAPEEWNPDHWQQISIYEILANP